MGEHADMDKHTDTELREAIRTADEQEPRIVEDGSEAAHEAQREQHDEMKKELHERED